MRRYRAALGSPGVGTVASPEMQKRDLPEKTRYDEFDTNAITPGTEFMYRLDAYLRGWIARNRLSLPSKVIYSSHLVPGEGEHKMMEYIRNGTIASNPLRNEGKIVVHAKDADLIFLMMMTEAPELVLWREGIGSQDNNIFIDIDALRYRITAIMSPEISESDNATEVDYSKIEDYVVLMIFLGNDFLHSIQLWLILVETIKTKHWVVLNQSIRLT
jgi:5'-3' exoribonuclease 1